MGPKNNAVELNEVCYRAGPSFEIRDLTLNVPYGSIYGFLGPNGSGKTTTIRLFTGMHQATRGEISVLGHPIPKRAPQAMARIGYVPETPHLYEALTVAESIRYHASFFPTWDDEWAGELLGRMALDPDQRVGRLSKWRTPSPRRSASRSKCGPCGGRRIGWGPRKQVRPSTSCPCS